MKDPYSPWLIQDTDLFWKLIDIIVEMGNHIWENTGKTETIAKYLPDDIILADDSGLEIDYLNKSRIYSARYAGVITSYDIKNQMLGQGVPDEKRTGIYLCHCGASGWYSRNCSWWSKMIGYEIAGEHGFGYDPIFYVPEYGCTTAEMDPVQKMNSITGTCTSCHACDYGSKERRIEGVFYESIDRQWYSWKTYKSY